MRVERGSFVLDVDVAPEPGRTLAVVGPNGAGKTTLLRAIAERADGAVGMVFQDHLLFPHLTAVENVAFGLRAAGVRRADARERARAWLGRVGLDERAEAMPHELSGGQAQRVALARALAIEPSVLLLDEPLAALDATTRNEVRRDLRRHLAPFAGVRVLVTHDPVDVAALADEVVVLDHGRAVQTGSPAELTRRPRTPWVADLVGTNLFAGEADAAGTVTLSGGGAVVTADHDHRGPVLVTVHPRAVAIHRSRPEGSARNAWPGRIRSLEPVGDRVRAQIEGAPWVVAEVTPGAVADIELVEGAEVWVAVKATEVDVYPA